MTIGKDLNLGFQTKCQTCNSERLELIMGLGHQAPCDSLLNLADLNELEVTYPLNLIYCLDCFLVQIDYVVPPEKLFPNSYPYRSGITKTLVQKLQNSAKAINLLYPFTKNDLVVDIGSNDGTLLSGFKKLGNKVIGIEPSDIALIANENGIETIQSFFSEAIAKSIVSTHGQAKVVTATNVFAHMPTVKSFLLGVKEILSPDGVFVTESHYLGDIVSENQYDSIYHEHLRFYSLHSVKTLLEIYGFKVTNVEFIDNYGGSIRIYSQHASTSNKEHRNVRETLIREKNSGLLEISTFINFANNSKKLKDELRELLISLSRKGLTIPGIGCPGRASTLVNYVGIDSSIMPFIAEQSSSLKVGLFLPGIHTPVVDEKVIFEQQPEYVLLLSWHYSKEIIKNLRNKGLSSKIILPLPSVTIS